MSKIYVINYDYAFEKYGSYEKRSVGAFNDIDKAKAKLKELTADLKKEMLVDYDEEDIEVEEGVMSYSIYIAYRYMEHHIDYWIDEVELN